MSKLKDYLNEAMDISPGNMRMEVEDISRGLNNLADDIRDLRKKSKAYFGKELTKAESDIRKIVPNLVGVIKKLQDMDKAWLEKFMRGKS